ncbi:AlpA family transcriptional regulator [Frigoribacterium sp. Leaf172]|uniref:helix-turn-helix transcriptional regulator n=1 Tax=Frigoribacterium sp. Leaf172 TaxID=1736285 RepID=UPI000AAFB65B|nr:helix-turn-helix domain-containing protein [Frigoribacterium sp. Leaf172]
MTTTTSQAPRLRRLLTLEETADALRRTPSQLRWLMHTGNCPASALVGGRRMFDAESVAAWLDEQFAQVS